MAQWSQFRNKVISTEQPWFHAVITKASLVVADYKLVQ